MAENKIHADVDWTRVRFSISTNLVRMTQWAFGSLLPGRGQAEPTRSEAHHPRPVLGTRLREKGRLPPISACLNLTRRIHFQLINRSTACRRRTQQLEPSSVEIKMVVPRHYQEPRHPTHETWRL